MRGCGAQSDHEGAVDEREKVVEMQGGTEVYYISLLASATQYSVLIRFLSSSAHSRPLPLLSLVLAHSCPPPTLVLRPLLSSHFLFNLPASAPQRR